MEKGTISFYNPDKNYGFIQCEGSEEILYFEGIDLKSNVKDGDEVIFQTGEGDKGKQAMEIWLAPPPLPPGQVPPMQKQSPDFF